jgi:hypothetical protein
MRARSPLLKASNQACSVWPTGVSGIAGTCDRAQVALRTKIGRSLSSMAQTVPECKYGRKGTASKSLSEIDTRRVDYQGVVYSERLRDTKPRGNRDSARK